ncbi:MAG: hypothetical protein NVSMB22_14300 [Chloroflexota bacterium]
MRRDVTLCFLWTDESGGTIFRLKIWWKHLWIEVCTAIDVVDNRSGEEEGVNPPYKVRRRRARYRT